MRNINTYDSKGTTGLNQFPFLSWHTGDGPRKGGYNG